MNNRNELNGSNYGVFERFQNCLLQNYVWVVVVIGLFIADVSWFMIIIVRDIVRSFACPQLPSVSSFVTEICML
jgi:hypothetical protein